MTFACVFLQNPCFCCYRVFLSTFSYHFRPTPESATFCSPQWTDWNDWVFGNARLDGWWLNDLLSRCCGIIPPKCLRLSLSTVLIYVFHAWFYPRRESATFLLATMTLKGWLNHFHVGSFMSSWYGRPHPPSGTSPTDRKLISRITSNRALICLLGMKSYHLYDDAQVAAHSCMRWYWSFQLLKLDVDCWETVSFILMSRGSENVWGNCW